VAVAGAGEHRAFEKSVVERALRRGGAGVAVGVKLSPDFTHDQIQIRVVDDFVSALVEP
jgi:hypothetical protein